MPYCTHCGTKEQDDQRYCGVCGAPRSGSVLSNPMPPVSPRSSNAEAQVLVGISLEPPRQSRWTVFFRLILALPLIIVFAGIEIAAFFVVVGAWFCALFTGRVPDNMQRFLTKALRFYANLQAYGYLLTSRWPGIVFDAKPDDQVTVAIDHVGLRRSSVFFRMILGYPAMFVGWLLGVGSYLMLFVMWAWGTAKGREPRSFHQAAALVVRFQIRSFAYMSLLTPTQPFRGFFGDEDFAPATSAVPGGPSLAGAGATLDFASGAPAPSTDAYATLPTHWMVSKAAKVVMVLVLVVGVPSYFLAFSVNNPLLSRFKTEISRALVTASHNVTDTAVSQFVQSAESCPTSNQRECIAKAASKAYPVLSGQSSLLSGNIFVPHDALSLATRYEVSLDNLQADILAVETAQTSQEQLSVIDKVLPQALSRFDADYLVLEERLAS